MRQAISVYYRPATNDHGPRLVASAAAGNITVAYDHGLSDERNYREAAKAFVEAHGWHGQWHGGVLRNGDYVFVMSEEPGTFTFEV